MNIEELREYCISLKGVKEDMPFDDKTLVFKVADKIFALTSLGGELAVSLKFDPEKVVSRQEKYSHVLPGFHLSKKHWVSVQLFPYSNKKQIERWITESYELVISKLPKKTRAEFM